MTTAPRIERGVDIIRHWSDADPDRPAISLGQDRRTWSELAARSAQVAHALLDAGVTAQDRIAFIDKNSVEYFEILFGGTMVNAVNVAVNWRLTPAEMHYIVNDAQAPLLVVHAEFVPQFEQMRDGLGQVRTVVVIGTDDLPEGTVGYESWIAGRSTEDPGVVPAPDDVCLQLYTSGTTGLPKGAQLSNANFAAILAAASDWAMSPDSVNMAAMPVFHIGGSGWALFGMAKGARTVLVRELDPVAVLNLIESERITHAFLVPAALQFLVLVHDDQDLSSMQLVVYGASPITEDVLVASMELFGCDFAQVYGLTETTGVLTQLSPEDHDPGGPRAHLLRSAGTPLPGVELRIVDTETAEPVADGEVGEIWVRSAQTMVGYWGLAEATAEAITDDGWFRTGDAAYLSDGYVFIHDRVKDMIVSGGENVYPAEVENALASHPAVADVAVIGVPDPRWGEVPKAIVVPAAGHEPSDELGHQLIAHSRERLAGFKTPKTVEFAESIPRNPSGKILKRDLRAPYWEGRDRNV